MSKFMALDYGLKHIGVAVNLGGLAEPVTSLDNDTQLFVQLKKLLEFYQTEQLVLGCSEGEMAKKTREFGRKVEEFFHLPIAYVDETLSSKEAAADLAWLKGKHKRRKPLHQLAAAIILERYIDEQ